MDFVYALAHYFYPRYSNNHKAKLLHSSTLFLLILILIFYQFSLQLFPATGLNVLGYASSISTDEVINLTNKERAQNGFLPLTYNEKLTQAAKAKGEHMLANQYWAHVAPDGTEPWKFFLDAGYQYKYAGENLARDFSSAASAVDAWMASPSHKDNLLSPKYTDIGVAVVEGQLDGVDTTIIVQLFGKPLAGTTPEIPIAEAKSVNTTPPTPTAYVALTPSPTQAPQVVAQVSVPPSQPEGNNTSETPVAGQSARMLFSPFDTTRMVSLATIIFLIVIMAVDGYVTSKRKMTRIGGRTFAHLAFLGMILAIALIAKAGEIL
jgi:uncharacterized protein YkwD